MKGLEQLKIDYGYAIFQMQTERIKKVKNKSQGLIFPTENNMVLISPIFHLKFTEKYDLPSYACV